MNTLIPILIVLISIFHVFAFCMESVFWQTPYAAKLFGTTSETAPAAGVWAFNQGVYNLFLVAGLAWSLLAADPLGFQLKVFFLLCVVIAGIAGGLSVSIRVFLAQGLPALIALVLVLLYH
jgi:putative membrane protein